MSKRYFLGANSKDGFYSLYDGFPPEGTLHIIKGGPGTGKSSFMKKLGVAAEEAGYETEYVLCSGDPASLDGLYIPELKQAWVDGTAPHVREPGIFGAESDYVNFSQFLKASSSKLPLEELRSVTAKYKAAYTRGYACFHSAAALRTAYRPDFLTNEQLSKLQRRIDGILNRQIGKGTREPGSIRRLFLSALCCQGQLRLSEEIFKLCKLIYSVDDGLSQAAGLLKHAAKSALARGANIIFCPSPLCPEEPEAVLLPEYSLAFVSDRWSMDNCRSIHADALGDKEILAPLRARQRRVKKQEAQLLSLGLEELHEAKRLHDALEAFYKPCMDFRALDRFTEREIKKYILPKER